jgi:hypothetical protein
MPARLRVVRPWRRRQVLLTGFAHIGHVKDRRFGESFRRQPLAQVSLVTGLAAGFAARRLFAHRRRRLGRVGGRRDRRVRRVLSQPGFQIPDACLKPIDQLEQFATSCAAWLLHAGMLTNAAFRSCASLQAVNGYQNGLPQTHRIILVIRDRMSRRRSVQPSDGPTYSSHNRFDTVAVDCRTESHKRLLGQQEQ